MAQEKKERIFISYKRVDRERVFAIKDGIKNATGEDCWIDLDGIESNAQFVAKIVGAIDECDVFLFMRSKEHNNITNLETDWTIREVNYALEEHKNIVIVNLDKTPMPKWFKFMFPNKQEIDATDPEKIDRPYKDLCGWLGVTPKAISQSKKVERPTDIVNKVAESADQMFTVNGISFKMIAVQGGTFTMGATAEQGSDALDREKPSHQVTLSEYRIGETEVTQELWQAVMGSNPSSFKGTQNPVEQVSWEDCQEFVKKLNQLTGKQFRLPTEAEWEYAARGGNKSRGFKYAGSNTLGNVAWYGDNSGNQTHSVKGKQPNELGLYDMSGNVWEWCEDWYGDYSSNAQTNPKGSVSGSDRVSIWNIFAKSCRVVRGGSWGYTRYSRVSYRDYLTPTCRYDDLGLRLAL